MKQLDLLGFSQTILTDYGPVTVASTAKNSDTSGPIATNDDVAGQIAKNSDAPAAWPVTIRWPADSKIGVIHGQWQRLPTGEIEATYQDAFELRNCLRFLAWSKGLDFEKIYSNHRKGSTKNENLG